jgi:hypothetical protein
MDDFNDQSRRDIGTAELNLYSDNNYIKPGICVCDGVYPWICITTLVCLLYDLEMFETKQERARVTADAVSRLSPHTTSFFAGTLLTTISSYTNGISHYPYISLNMFVADLRASYGMVAD